MNFLKSKNKFGTIRCQPRYSTMSTKTKDFIQKICYKKTASVDMIKHGFICDNKMYAVNLLLRPLREKLEKICGKHTEDMLLRGNQKKPASSRKHKPAASKASRTRNVNANRAKLKNKKPSNQGRRV